MIKHLYLISYHHINYHFCFYSVLKFPKRILPLMPSTILNSTCPMWARTTLREVLIASISMCQGNCHWSASVLTTHCEKLVPLSFLCHTPSLSVAQGPHAWHCWQQYRTRSQCAPLMIPTRWPGNAWPRLQRTHVNVGPKSSSLVASTEVRLSLLHLM